MNESFYPELSEKGQQEATRLIEFFKHELTTAATKIANETIGMLYSDVMPYIESDSWTNFRNHVVDAYKGYQNHEVCFQHDFKAIRQQIFNEFRNEIIDDLNKDLVEENKQLRQEIEWLQRRQI